MAVAVAVVAAVVVAEGDGPGPGSSVAEHVRWVLDHRGQSSHLEAYQPSWAQVDSLADHQQQTRQGACVEPYRVGPYLDAGLGPLDGQEALRGVEECLDGQETAGSSSSLSQKPSAARRLMRTNPTEPDDHTCDDTKASRWINATCVALNQCQ